jgi:hypothetical protein
MRLVTETWERHTIYVNHAPGGKNFCSKTTRLYAMAPTKKLSSDTKTRSSGSQISLQKVKGENFYRNAKQVKRLKMLSGGKAVRDRDGKIIEAAAFQKGEDETMPGRVQPDRRWFGTSSLCLTNLANESTLIFFFYLQVTPG